MEEEGLPAPMGRSYHDLSSQQLKDLPKVAGASANTEGKEVLVALARSHNLDPATEKVWLACPLVFGWGGCQFLNLLSLLPIT